MSEPIANQLITISDQWFDQLISLESEHRATRDHQKAIENSDRSILIAKELVRNHVTLSSSVQESIDRLQLRQVTTDSVELTIALRELNPAWQAYRSRMIELAGVFFKAGQNEDTQFRVNYFLRIKWEQLWNNVFEEYVGSYRYDEFELLRKIYCHIGMYQTVGVINDKTNKTPITYQPPIQHKSMRKTTSTNYTVRELQTMKKNFSAFITRNDTDRSSRFESTSKEALLKQDQATELQTALDNWKKTFSEKPSMTAIHREFDGITEMVKINTSIINLLNRFTEIVRGAANTKCLDFIKASTISFRQKMNNIQDAIEQTLQDVSPGSYATLYKQHARIELMKTYVAEIERFNDISMEPLVRTIQNSQVQMAKQHVDDIIRALGPTVATLSKASTQQFQRARLSLYAQLTKFESYRAMYGRMNNLHNRLKNISDPDEHPSTVIAFLQHSKQQPAVFDEHSLHLHRRLSRFEADIERNIEESELSQGDIWFDPAIRTQFGLTNEVRKANDEIQASLSTAFRSSISALTNLIASAVNNDTRWAPLGTLDMPERLIPDEFIQMLRQPLHDHLNDCSIDTDKLSRTKIELIQSGISIAMIANDPIQRCWLPGFSLVTMRKPNPTPMSSLLKLFGFILFVRYQSKLYRLLPQASK